MKNTKNEVKNPVSTIGFKEVLNKKNSLKLSAIQSKQIDELLSKDSFSEAFALCEKIENGVSVSSVYSFQETDTHYVISIPKSSLNTTDNFRTPEKGKAKIPYRVLFTVGQWASDRVLQKVGLKLTLFEYEK